MVGMSVEASRHTPADAAGAQFLPTHPDRTAALARLAAGIAHELRNPLAVVLARVQLLQLTLKSGKPLPPAKLEQSLRAVEEQALRASKVIENLSSFARPRAPELGLVDLPDMISRVLTLLRHRMPETGFSVEVDVRPDAKALLADAGQLLTALTQLVLNGIEAMPAGGVLRIRAQRTDGSIEISVTDSGPGIAQHDAPRIFDPFFSTKTSAAGLGLCVAQTIAESHGGALRLDHAGTAGAEFVLALPVRSLA
jgi:signal transduction histidine kinase